MGAFRGSRRFLKRRGAKCASAFPLGAVAVEAQPMPTEYVDAENLYVTDACVEYLRPLIGELPKYVKLF
ncbi:MAG: hypothetical protein IIY07_05595 [Thermoguttaceae bacterium]|nr:hypothetical protein [Thermoguttaceae bacterium]